MAQSITLLLGPAGSGKTNQLLVDYGRELSRARQARELGTALWLTPTLRSRSQLIERLFMVPSPGNEITVPFNGTRSDPDPQRKPALPVVVRPRIETFESFAEQVLSAAPQKYQRLSSVGQRRVLARILEERKPNLKVFGKVAEGSGFLDLVSSFITELKREEIWPEEFSSACHERGIRPSDQDLIQVYEDYQRWLHEHSCYDSEGRFWLARDLLGAGNFSPFQNCRLVVVDGFIDFTKTQYEILGMLATRVQEFKIAFPFEEKGSAFARQGALFHTIQETIERLEEITKLPMRLVNTRLPEWAYSSSIGRISQRLFADVPQRAERLSNNDQGDPGPFPGRVNPVHEELEIIRGIGASGEVQSIARRVKKLLLLGVPAAEIVIAVRFFEEYRSLFRDQFEEAGIPIEFGTAPRWIESPEVRVIWKLLELIRDDWPIEGLESFLNISLFQPDLPEWSSSGKRALLDLIEELSIPSGRKKILNTLEQIAGETLSPVSDPDPFQGIQADQEIPAESLEPGNQEEIEEVFELLRDQGEAPSKREKKAEQQKLAWRLAKRLDDILSPLRGEHRWSAWLDLLQQVLTNLGAMDEKLLLIWGEVREQFSDQKYSSDGFAESGVLSFERFAHDFHDLLSRERPAPVSFDSSSVRILDLSHVRALDVPYLFVVGLAEGSFPRLGHHSPLLSDRDRIEFRHFGLRLPDRSRELNSEMLLFYSLITRARRRLTLSFPITRTNGQPLSPSPYLILVEDLFGPGSLYQGLEPHPAQIPTVETAISVRDLRILATASALDGNAGLLRSYSMLEAKHSSQPQQVPVRGKEPAVRGNLDQILAAAEMDHERFQKQNFSIYEGILLNARVKALLDERFPQNHRYQVTQLEAYARCPFRFFAEKILNVREEMESLVGINQRYRGNILHRVLRRFHQSSPQTEDRFERLVGEEIFRETPSDERKNLLEIERETLKNWALKYLNQQTSYQASFRSKQDAFPIPKYFELEFGKENEILFSDGSIDVYVTGRIDRIDVQESDTEHQFIVIDYKTGDSKPRKINNLAQNLQQVIYPIALSRMFETKGKNPALGTEQSDDKTVPNGRMGYWNLKYEGFEEVSLDEMNPEEAMNRIVPQLARGIREGDFRVYNSDSDCSSRCPLKTTCRVGQVRSVGEFLNKDGYGFEIK